MISTYAAEIISFLHSYYVQIQYNSYYFYFHQTNLDLFIFNWNFDLSRIIFYQAVQNKNVWANE